MYIRLLSRTVSIRTSYYQLLFTNYYLLIIIYRLPLTFIIFYYSFIIYRLLFTFTIYQKKGS